MASQQAMLQQMIEQATLQQISQAEAQVDAQLHELESMDKEELEELEAIRKRKMEYMRNAKARKQIGHGELREIGGSGSEQEFFEAAKASDKMVCHFFRDGNERCPIVDMHLQKLAVQHGGTRFVKMNAEKAPFLAERLRIIFLPTICVVMKGKVKDYIVGFDDLGGTDDFDTEVLEWRLGSTGVLDYNGDLDGPPKPEGSERRGFIGKGKKTRMTHHGYDTDSDDDF
jgi:hypothetical protein